MSLPALDFSLGVVTLVEATTVSLALNPSADTIPVDGTYVNNESSFKGCGFVPAPSATKVTKCVDGEVSSESTFGSGLIEV